MVMISSRVFPPLLPMTANNISTSCSWGRMQGRLFRDIGGLHLSRVGIKENAAQKQTLGGVTRSAGATGEIMDAAFGFGLALPDGTPARSRSTRSISFPTD